MTASGSSQLFTYSKLDKSSFDAIAEDYADVVIPLEQTPYWADFEHALGRRHLGIWAYRDSAGELIATASFVQVTRRLRHSVVAVNGPVWYTERAPETERVLLQTVRAQFREPGPTGPLYARMQVATLQSPATQPIEYGWYEREILVDLTPDENDLLKSLGSNARNRIARAERNGVEVRQIPRERWTDVFATQLFPIMRETANRGGFHSFDSAYYETFLAVLGGHVRLMVAYKDDVPLSWLITTEYRGNSMYYFAGSTYQARSTFAPYLLLWEAFKVLKAAGNTACGLTGIESENYPSLANVTAFKKNFSKNVVVVPTTYDVPLSRSRYAFLTKLLKARRGALLSARENRRSKLPAEAGVVGRVTAKGWRGSYQPFFKSWASITMMPLGPRT
ncbi:peptidoglycan bridge formation glycyltransferase FemA/FemB family protein [Arthrobacter sp. JZ12]|uniref:lipid II:glycine glycyltransferase FemX n=1 Tax=Arthrobacter sp. JZ12 TaxID=2654190 RepID=UPI002B480A54|nr:peptidoglycan bridge formation glycyltransferase FemA/FemB family protein [Arthrobacter sp. JZ12]WRH24112.1 peptidoglycan bridge formation glycyltransferase FemA/FemB family protein [Arthrobacter sp. JZ12]